MCAAIAIVDLHVHLRGTLEPADAKWLARAHSLQLPRALLDEEGRYQWANFDEFLTVYDKVGHVIRKQADLYFLARKYLASSAAQGTIYVEFMLSPGHSEANGISLEDQIEAVERAVRDERENSDIESGLIITAVRHQGGGAARELAERVVAINSSVIVGFGLTGNERKFDIEDFVGAFLIAGQAGLGLTAHAGEWLGPQTVLRSVEALGLARVGHGVRAVEDESVLAELAARRTGFEVGLSSNRMLKVHPELRNHPVKTMLDAGCLVSLATDDPAYFQTSPAREYEVAHDEVGVSLAQLRNISENSIDLAFCSAEIKQKLRKKLSICM